MNLFKKTYSIVTTFPPEFGFLVGATFLNQLGNMVQVFLVLYLTVHLGFTLPEASFVFGTFAVSVLMTNMLCGSIVDRVGPVRLQIAILFCNALVLMSFTLLHTFHHIVWMCVVWGVVFGLYRPCSQTFVTLLTPEGHHKVGFSFYRLAINLGLSVGPAVGGYLATHSFYAIFFVNGFANLAACAVIYFGFRNTAWFNHKSNNKKSNNEKRPPLDLQLLKQDKNFFIFLLALLPITMVFFQYSSPMSVFTTQYLHLSLQFYGFLFTVNTMLIIFFEVPLNVATVKWSSRFSLALGSFLIGLGFFGFLFAQRPWEIIFLTMIWSFGEMILYPSSSSYVAEIAPADRRGSYMSFYSLFLNLGIFLGPWSGLLLLHQWGASSLWVACGLCGMTSVIIFSLKTPEEDSSSLEVNAI